MLIESAGCFKTVRNARFAYAQNISWTVATKYFKRYQNFIELTGFYITSQTSHYMKRNTNITS